MNTARCDWCGEPLIETTRADRLTCSERCKKARQRAARLLGIGTGNVPATPAEPGQDRRAVDVARELEALAAKGRP